MSKSVDHTNFHRTAKYFMDNGRAATPEDAMSILESFGLSIVVGDEVVTSRDHQIALLTLVNTARRTFLGGIEVAGAPDAALLVNLGAGDSLHSAIHHLGGTLTSEPRGDWPAAIIGTPEKLPAQSPAWQLHWSGWRGGVRSVRDKLPEPQGDAIVLAPILAAAICVAEVFAYHSGDHPMAGLRSAGISLWCPDHNWLIEDFREPQFSNLPSRLWLVGLGNLGQAYSWILACLPYQDRSAVELVLQDFDDLGESNDSTSLLSTLQDVGRKKTRVVAEWLETVGFQTLIEERRFGTWSRRAPHEPGVALWGVDNALARVSIDDAGFELVVEAGLGAGPNAFRNFSLHTLPASRSSAQIWSQHLSSTNRIAYDAPAYNALKKRGVDECGLAQLASRTVGVPFVGLTAGVFVIAELLRRLHNSAGLEQLSGSLQSVEDIEFVSTDSKPYEWGHVPCRQTATKSRLIA